MKVTCIGSGYVGGPTMAVLADKCPGIKVYVYDNNKDLIERWNSDDIPVFELGLREIIQKNLGNSLFFTSDLKMALEDSNIIFIAVNTPTKTTGKGEKRACDTKYFESALRDVVEIISQAPLKDDIILVEKSTLPVRTCEWVRQIFCDNQIQYPENKDKLIIVSNPEFLAEGSAINDLLNPDRIIIGSENLQNSSKGVETLKKLYMNWIEEERIFTPNIFSSELGKLVSNAFLAQRVSSINSIAAICEKTGADIEEVGLLIGSDSRIGKKFLKPSVGFGGSCLNKDVLHLVYLCESLGLHEVAEYWEGVVQINEFQKKRFSDGIITKMFNNLYKKPISVFGVAFKKNTKDVRGSAALEIAYNLLQEGAILNVYDPKAERKDFIIQMKFMNYWESGYEERIVWYNDPYESSNSAHAVIILTEWDEFGTYDYAKIFEHMKKPAFLFDGRNLLNLKEMKNIGFEAFSIGKVV